jgi:hypothetical protein
MAGVTAAQTRTTVATILCKAKDMGGIGNNDDDINNVILSVDNEAGTADSLVKSDVVMNRR